MKTLTITISSDACGFDVTDEQGRCCDGLGWDEMLGQVATLTMPPERLGKGYAMRTPAEWHAYREARSHGIDEIPNPFESKE